MNVHDIDRARTSVRNLRHPIVRRRLLRFIRQVEDLFMENERLKTVKVTTLKKGDTIKCVVIENLLPAGSISMQVGEHPSE